VLQKCDANTYYIKDEIVGSTGKGRGCEHGDEYMDLVKAEKFFKQNDPYIFPLSLYEYVRLQYNLEHVICCLQNTGSGKET
jgi:hypothetical protein